jgi:lipoate-protein ligase B
VKLEERIAYWVDLGNRDYEETFRLQKSLVELRKNELIRDTILFCEHPSTVDFSLSKNNNKFSQEWLSIIGDKDPIEVLKSLGIKFTYTNRGGGATYIGPGQLVVYPIVDHTKITGKLLDISSYKEKIDQIMWDVLKSFGIPAQIVKVSDELDENNSDLRKDRRDVWVKKNGKSYKLGGKGTYMSGNVSYHGFSLYLTKESTKGFAYIDICGYPKSILDSTSIEEEIGREVNRTDVRERVLRSIKKHFGYDNIIESDLEEIQNAKTQYG